MELRLRSRQIGHAAALLCALLLCACSTVRHGYSTADYAGRTLASSSPLGAERLAQEQAYDSAVADFVGRHGQPAFIHVADRDLLYLFYPERDMLASIRREMLPPGEVVVHERIPGHFFRLLPPAEVRRIQSLRASKKSRSPGPARQPAQPAALPAAPQAAGLSLSSFDPDSMIARLREPLSAADAGVSGWRTATLADGTHSRIARSGRTEYRIQRDAVSAAAPISSRSRSASSEIRTGYVRVNRAVFGTRASAINRSVEPLVARVAADPSGRTRILQRVAGRTLSVTRDTRRGLLVYRVGAD